jgi:hypothetical protein
MHDLHACAGSPGGAVTRPSSTHEEIARRLLVVRAELEVIARKLARLRAENAAPAREMVVLAIRGVEGARRELP